MSESRRPNLTVSGSLSPNVNGSGRHSPTVTVSGSLSPNVTVSGSLSPNVTVSGSLSPTVTVSGSLSPTVTVSGSLSPTVTVSGSLSPNVTVSGSLSPNVTVSGSLSPNVTVSGSHSPFVTMDRSHDPNVNVSGSHSTNVNLSGSDYQTLNRSRSPIVSGSRSVILSGLHSPTTSGFHSPTRSGSHGLILTGSHSPIVGGSHSPILSGSSSPILGTLSPILSESHSPPVSRSHSPILSGSHSSTVSRSHSPNMNGSHSSTVSRSHSPNMSGSHNPNVSGVHSPNVSESHSPNVSESHSLNMSANCVLNLNEIPTPSSIEDYDQILRGLPTQNVSGTCSRRQNLRSNEHGRIDHLGGRPSLSITITRDPSSEQTAGSSTDMGLPGISLESPSTSAGSSAQEGATSTAPGTPNTDLVALFECPVCFDYVLPPILQCHRGHLVCGQCRPKLTGCPICRGPLASIRNLAMEKLATTMLFPCKFNPYGCGVRVPSAEKTGHEELCEFRPYSCPCPGVVCQWQGPLDAVIYHLTQRHRPITTIQGENVIFLATNVNLPGAIDWVMIQSCHGFHFLLILEKQEKYEGYEQFFALVQLIGTRRQAEHFDYRMELYNHQRRLTWEAATRSIHDGVMPLINNNECLIFDTTTAQLFAEDNSLCINVTIVMS